MSLLPNMTYMELSTVPTYMDEFVGACFIPHTDTGMFPTVMEEIQRTNAEQLVNEFQ